MKLSRYLKRCIIEEPRPIQSCLGDFRGFGIERSTLSNGPHKKNVILQTLTSIDEHHPFSTSTVTVINLVFCNVILDYSKVHIQLKKYYFCYHGTNTDEIHSKYQTVMSW